MKTILLILLTMGMVQTGFAQLKDIDYSDGEQKLKGLLSGADQKNKPGVLILPAWMGIDDEAKTAAENLAKAGYTAFIADIYGQGNIPKTSAEAGKIAGQFKSDYALYQRRIKAALDELVKQGADPQRIAVIGYCFGGTGALEAARAQLPVKAVVSIHGGLGKGERANGPVRTKVLVLHGASDASVPASDIVALQKELDDAAADWQMIYYAASKHTFTNPKSQDYNPLAAKRSWQHLMMFLEEVLEK
ncbi:MULTISPECIES: dienelactone hydrolase family protein [unclassified Sphingobacterium]|uniref:dienelactone hydrolase family protein n=1 Tax=unclassified Sphingobacterium TaxID=2609468 RepID=UPI0025E03D53|nr:MULTISPECIES: dienelactone hydrolase family protein [unclassified Sphingobacterium]